jgi:hypothetical protein
MAQQGARPNAKCTNAVQFGNASVTSVFQNQSVVKDHFNGSTRHGGLAATPPSIAQELTRLTKLLDTRSIQKKRDANEEEESHRNAGIGAIAPATQPTG